MAIEQTRGHRVLAITTLLPALCLLGLAPAALSQEMDGLRAANRLLEGRWDRYALRHLVTVLQSPASNDETRNTVAELLKAERYAPAVEGVIGALRDDNWRVRAAAAEILGDAMSLTREELREGSLPPYLEAFKDDVSEEVREVVEQRWQQTLRDMLQEIERKAPPALIAALVGDSHDEVRVEAAAALGEIGSKSAAGALMDAARERDPELRQAAAIALGGVGDKQVVPTLILLLKDPVWSVRTAASQGLVGIGRDAIPALIDTLREENWRTRWNAEEVLSMIGDHTALDGLAATFASGNWRTRVCVVRLLGDISDRLLRDRKSLDAIPSLLEQATPKLSDMTEEEGERKQAVLAREQALSNLKTMTEKIKECVVPVLLRALEDYNAEIRAEAATALGKVGSREPVSGLVLALKHETQELRTVAEGIQAMLTAVNTASAEALNKVLGKPDPSPEVRLQATLALGLIKHHSSIPILVTALSDADLSVQDAAQRTLDQLRKE